MAPAFGAARSAEDAVGTALRPWQPGSLDIHHIATGRGDSTLIIGPDGTSMMIDAGASATPPPAAFETRPGNDRRAGEWIGRYARRQLAATGRSALDVFLATHLHPDHVGDVTPDSPRARDGDYRLTGVSDVEAILPIRRVVDRGFPDYSFPRPLSAAFAANYQAYIRWRIATRRAVERFRVGAADQFSLVHERSAWPGFEVRNLAANGEVWTGEGNGTRSLFPSLKDLAEEDIPEENVCSAALRLRFGEFSYFAAGDLTNTTYYGALPWRDVESAAAKVAGPVDVAVAPHHGMFDASGPEMVRSLRPAVWIISPWHAVHPNMSALERIFSNRLYPEPRLVLATGLSPANVLANQRLTDRMASREGHVVIRVGEGGSRYRVVVTDNRDEGDRVTAVFDPSPAPRP